MKPKFIHKIGKLTYAEFAVHAIDNLQRHQLFDSFDTNKDGFLTKVELVDAMDVNGRCIQDQNL